MKTDNGLDELKQKNISDKKRDIESVIKTLLNIIEIDTTESMKDEFLVSTIGSVLSDKFAIGRLKGRHSWWDPNFITIDSLKLLLQMATDSNNRIDVIFYSSILLIRERMESKDEK